MRKVKKVLIHLKTGKKFFVRDLDNFHTQYGVISKKELSSKKDLIESNKKEKFVLLNPEFADLQENLKRGPQLMLPKDIGMIIAKTGIGKNSKVVDAGGGTGALCLTLANVCKEVTVYEINPEHYSVVNKNKELFGINNLDLKQADIYKKIDEKNVDLVTLDLPEPWRAVENVEKALKTGGHLTVYLPNLNQVKMLIDSLHGTRIKVTETLELIERKWKIEDRIMRPEFQMLGHTGFLTFCRKL